MSSTTLSPETITDISRQTFYISIEELLIAFKALPANPDNRLRFITLPIPLPGADGQVTKVALQFDWNVTCNDWELTQGQPITITACHRSTDLSAFL